MVVTYPDGSTRVFPDGATFLDAAQSISEGFGRKVLAAKVGEDVFDLSRPVPGDVSVLFLTFDDKEGRSVYWHSSAHIMAAAVKRLFPEVKVAIGPAIDDGFYYDFDVKTPFSERDLEKIEEEMRVITRENEPFERIEITRKEAMSRFRDEEEPYKIELADGLVDQDVTLYRLGDFYDLCRGPHVPSAGRIKAFKLLSTAGAYWARG